MSWQYDVAGNRWTQTLNSNTAPSYSFTGGSNGNTNQIDGASYDAMGNLKTDFIVPPANEYTYDAEGRVYKVNTGSTAVYTYDAFGQRVKGPSYEYVYDLAGHPATLLNQSTDAWVADEIYAGGRHLASYFGTNTYFVHTDHLGTERARTDASGTICQTTTNQPFGDAQTNPTNNCSDPDGRTIGGMEFDPETALEQTMYRKYYSNPGRWMTPDPAGSAVADPSNPQSWNRYGYVNNNPVSFIDPSGLDLEYGWGCDPLDLIDDDDTCDGGGGYVIIIPPYIGGGGGGGGGRGDGGQGGGQPSNNPNRKFGTETLGLPNGLRLTPRSIWSVFLPVDPSCEFGICVPLSTWTTDASGYAVGSYAWEIYCPPGLSCNVWNPFTHQWQEDMPLNANAQAVFDDPVLQNAAVTMTNPCTYIAWAGASAVVGGTGVAVVHAGEISTAAVDNAPSLFHRLSQWLYGRGGRMPAPRFIGTSVATTVAAGKAAVAGCKSF